MDRYFNTFERCEKLYAEALKWVGTPFADYSASPGKTGGVSCGYLAVALLKSCGHFPESTRIPRVSWKHNHGTRSSTIEQAFDQWTEDGLFVSVAPSESLEILVGDVLGIRIKNCVDHIAMQLSHNQIISIRIRGRVQIAHYSPERLTRIWRPINHAAK